jgi:hypothetical protein
LENGGEIPHLSPADRRNLIAEQLKDTPEKSNRQIAETLKVNHETVGTVRNELEDGGEIRHHEKRIDKRGTMQPAKRSSVFATDKAQSQRAFAALARKVIFNCGISAVPSLASLHGESETQPPQPPPFNATLHRTSRNAPDRAIASPSHPTRHRSNKREV